MISRNSITSAYPTKRLGEVVEFLDSKRRPVTESDRRAGPYPYYGATGIQGTIDEFIFDEPLVLLAEDGGHFGEPDRGIAYRISGKTWVNNHAHVLRPTSLIDLAYLCRVLENYDVKPFVTGTTRGKLTKAGASEIVIPLPPLAEQRRIAEVLDRAEALRAKRRAALTQLDSLTQSLFLDMFGDPVANPKGWPDPSLGSSLTFQLYGPRFYNETYNDAGIRIVRITDLDEAGNLDFDSMPRLVVCEEDIAKYALLPGDIIFARTGATVGKVALIKNGDPPCIAGAYFIVMRFSDALLPTFVRSVLTSDSVRSIVATRSRQAAQQNFSGPGLRALPMPIPPIKLQCEFARRVTAVETLKTAHRASLAELDALFATLQHRAFRGEL